MNGIDSFVKSVLNNSKSNVFQEKTLCFQLLQQLTGGGGVGAGGLGTLGNLGNLGNLGLGKYAHLIKQYFIEQFSQSKSY